MKKRNARILPPLVMPLKAAFGVQMIVTAVVLTTNAA